MHHYGITCKDLYVSLVRYNSFFVISNTITFDFWFGTFPAPPPPPTIPDIPFPFILLLLAVKPSSVGGISILCNTDDRCYTGTLLFLQCNHNSRLI